MLDIKTLLPELKKLVTDVSEDLLARSAATNDPYSAKVDSGLREAYGQIEKGGRTADAFEVWREDYLDQVAVAWVLGCVFVRFMEDNHLIDECWLAGDGDRRKLAEDTHELYFRAHPHESDREYFEHVFHEVGKIPACRDLFAEGKTPLWAVGLSGDAAMKLLAFWRDPVPETGELQRSFEVEDGDTRFLGDLYQDLSDAAQKKYALKQTPVFVEEFILDRTLNPAIDEFGLDEVRMIDPTCGSGHFLLGGFARLFDLWIKREDNEVVAAQKALDGVWGCDINPFAVAIARFRLIVAALRVCGIKRLKDAPAWNIHLATGDSLLFGSRWEIDGRKRAEARFLDESWAPELYACEDKEAISEVLGQRYHAVVGNPPYITVKDKSLNQAYRGRYLTCHRKYSLAVPFTERFFDLTATTAEGRVGFVGMLTTNAFMKREYGKKLVENYLPKRDLTHIIDTAGAYIPGHGTPTVILFGRNRSPAGDSLRLLSGLKGEPETPLDPAEGLVWSAITQFVDQSNCGNAYISASDVSREVLKSHPWSLGGGGASELHSQLMDSCDHSLSDVVSVVGVFGMTNADEAFLSDRRTFRRQNVENEYVRQFQIGDEIRDWRADAGDYSIFPYLNDGTLVDIQEMPHIHKVLWPVRTVLGNRATFDKNTYFQEGLPWWKWHQVALDRLTTPLTLVFPFVASHNHFILDRGEKVYNRSAPIIKLHEGASHEDHLCLLGLLNSSTNCFLMKQVSQQKQLTGGDGVRVQSRAKVPYEFAITQMKRLPIPSLFIRGELRTRLGVLTKNLNELARSYEFLTASQAIDEGLKSGESIAELHDSFVLRRSAILHRMVFMQEESDFTVYAMFGLCNHELLCDAFENPDLSARIGQRPFEILQGANVDGHDVPKEIPAWPEVQRKAWEMRCESIRSSPDLSVIEDDHYKRRWIGRQGLFNHTARQDELKSACRDWLLDRLESEYYWPRSAEECKLQSVSSITDLAHGDPDFLRVAAVLRGRDDFDVSVVVMELIETESVPLVPASCYKPSGLRKLSVWLEAWRHQRQEDRGAVAAQLKSPPVFAAGDFSKADYWRLRGKLNVPKERWISFPHFETESDPSLVVGWAGWNHLQQATAIVAYYDARKREGWDAKRLTPLLAGLDQLLPWIHQWHPEVDPEFGETAGQSFETMLKADAHELGLTLEEIRAWEPPAKKKGGRRKAKG